MDHNKKDGLEIIEGIKQVAQSAVMLAYLMGDSEEHILDCIEKVWREKLTSIDGDALCTALIVCLEMSMAWNDAVEALGDNSGFHRDAFAKRISKLMLEEQAYENR